MGAVYEYVNRTKFQDLEDLTNQALQTMTQPDRSTLRPKGFAELQKSFHTLKKFFIEE